MTSGGESARGDEAATGVAEDRTRESRTRAQRTRRMKHLQSMMRDRSCEAPALKSDSETGMCLDVKGATRRAAVLYGERGGLSMDRNRKGRDSPRRTPRTQSPD